MSEHKPKIESHVPLPASTRAFVCADCGAVSLDADGICRVQGMATRGDWCGTPSLAPAHHCRNHVHNVRYRCHKCGRAAVNPGLLCEPVKMPSHTG
jgi:predicted RNA-binding Zn-ribbon protein involved in translation (DUF1610 family)